MRTIYTDSETEKTIEKIKEKNPQFNLSSFIKNCLIEYNGEEEETSILKLDHDIKMAEIELQQVQETLNYVKDKKIKFLAKSKIEEEKQQTDIEILRATILKYYEIPEKLANTLAKEYIESNTSVSITKFIDDKGLKDNWRNKKN